MCLPFQASKYFEAIAETPATVRIIKSGPNIRAKIKAVISVDSGLYEALNSFAKSLFVIQQITKTYTAEIKISVHIYGNIPKKHKIIAEDIRKTR